MKLVLIIHHQIANIMAIHEAHRLKPMSENYDVQLFNTLYEKTKNLRRSLVNGIDCRRFGLPPEEILSWFDIKFIHAFNKYHEKFNSEVLLGHIINALKLYKSRVIRQSYTKACDIHKCTISLEAYHTDEDELPELQENPTEAFHSHYYYVLADFLKQRLSDDAFYLWEFELNPPPYVLRRMNELGCKNLQKIPTEVLLEYFELGFGKKAYKYLANLQAEIKSGIDASKKHFRRN